MNKYEYKFVRLECRAGGVFSRVSPAEEQYRDEIRMRAGHRWRLVQVFAPGIAGYGHAKHYEIIFERELAPGSGDA